MREYLRGMIAKDRNAYISRARENMDPDVALARIARGSPPPGVWRRLPGCACGLAGRRGATSRRRHSLPSYRQLKGRRCLSACRLRRETHSRTPYPSAKPTIRAIAISKLVSPIRELEVT